MPVTMYRGHTYQILWKRFAGAATQEWNRSGSLICILIDGHRHPAEAIWHAADTPEMACTRFIDRMIDVLGPILATQQGFPRFRRHSRKRMRTSRNRRKQNLALVARRVIVRNAQSVSRTQRCVSHLVAV